MRQVVARRDDNWKKLQQYILDERERSSCAAPNRAADLGRAPRLHLVHPRRVLRPQPGEVQRRRRSARPIAASPKPSTCARQKRRDSARRRDAARRRPQRRRARADVGDESAALLRQTREPQFISSAYFLRFKFEEGKYALVGRETLDGRDVLRVEYYPARMFTGTDRRRNRARQATIGRRQGARRRDAADDEQGRARHAVGRAERASDRQVHVRQRRLRLPAGAVARAHQRRRRRR